MTKYPDQHSQPYPGPHYADGRYIYGPALKSLGRAFDTEDQPIETVCATARLWAAAWELLEVCKAQDAVEARTRALISVVEDWTLATPDQITEIKAIGEEVSRVKRLRAAAIAKATGEETE